MSRYDPDLGWVRSSLTLRLWFAGFGLVACAAGAVLFFVLGPLWAAIGFVVLGVVAAADMAVVARRMRR